RAGWWKQSLELARDYLIAQGIAEPLSYELHRPFPIVRADMARILADAAKVNPLNPPQWRTLYGNLANAGGGQDVDGKLSSRHATAKGGAWLSTVDHSFAGVQSRVRTGFKVRSPWER